MFRNSRPSDISLKNFGAGSIVEGAPSEKWLVVADGDRRVRLVDMVYYGAIGGSIEVEDPNWLTEEQARKLVGLIDDGYTFSDYTLHPAGIKQTQK